MRRKPPGVRIPLLPPKIKGAARPFIFGASRVRTTAAEADRDSVIVLSAVGSRFAAASGCEAIEPLEKEGIDLVHFFLEQIAKEKKACPPPLIAAAGGSAHPSGAGILGFFEKPCAPKVLSALANDVIVCVGDGKANAIGPYIQSEIILLPVLFHIVLSPATMITGFGNPVQISKNANPLTCVCG